MQQQITTSRATVSLKDIGLRKGGRTIFDGLDLEIGDARTGLVGRNGSGKSMLARLTCGLIEPDAGEVRVCGVDVARDRRAAIGVVGILFQNPDHQIIFPTVEEEIAFGLIQQGRTRAEASGEVRAILARFGRAHWAERSIQTLSQGQRHLLCLMSVIAMKPGLIVLDEPFAGLDLPTTAQLTRHLAALDIALLHVSHDLAALEGYDRVIWLEAGRIEADGPPGEVLAAYRAAMEEIGAGHDLPDV